MNRRTVTSLFVGALLITGALLAESFYPSTRQIIYRDFSYQVETPRSWRQVNLYEPQALSIGNIHDEAYGMIFAGNLEILNEISLEDFFAKRAAVLEEEIKILHRTEPVKEQINNMEAMHYELRGMEKDKELIYRMAILRGQRQIIMAILWTTAEHLDDNRKDMQQVIAGIRELPGYMIDTNARRFAKAMGFEEIVESYVGEFTALASSLSENPEMIRKGERAFSRQQLAPLGIRYIANFGDLELMKRVADAWSESEFKSFPDPLRTKQSADEMKKFVEFMKTANPDAPENSARTKLIREMIEVTGIDRESAARRAILWEAVMLAMIDISRMEEAPSQAEINVQMAEIYHQSLKNSSSILLISSLFLYRDIPDEKLRAYIDFLKTPDMQASRKLIRDAHAWLIGQGGYQYTEGFQ